MCVNGRQYAARIAHVASVAGASLAVMSRLIGHALASLYSNDMRENDVLPAALSTINRATAA